MPRLLAALALAHLTSVAAKRVRYLLHQDSEPEQPSTLDEEAQWPFQKKEQAPHFWSRRGGNPKMNSDVPWTAPSDFSQGPSWTWTNPLGEQVRHSPLIDRDFNIYITSSVHIRKFSWSGTQLWTWRSPTADQGFSGSHEMTAAPTLYGDALLALVKNGTAGVNVHSLSLATGAVNWQRQHAVGSAPDASALAVFNGTLVFGAGDLAGPAYGADDSNRKVFAVSASDGSYLWDFSIDGVVWNFSPSMPGDGTLLFATSCGTAYRLDFDGRLLWKSVGRDPMVVCGGGGGALGPNGVYYVSYARGKMAQLPGNFFDAYRVSDGALLWNTTVKFGRANAASIQYPAVGKLGKYGPLAVVVSIGDQPLLPGQDMMQESTRKLYANHTLSNAVVALDAETGKRLWLSEEPPWPSTVAAGDEMGNWIARIEDKPHLSPVCWPEAQAIPVISGDGTVYASSGHSGELRAIHVRNANNTVDGMVGVAGISTFFPGSCFLNSPSLAPGMLVAAPCWGPTYVFLGPK